MCGGHGRAGSGVPRPVLTSPTQHHAGRHGETHGPYKMASRPCLSRCHVWFERETQARASKLITPTVTISGRMQGTDTRFRLTLRRSCPLGSVTVLVSQTQRGRGACPGPHSRLAAGVSPLTAAEEKASSPRSSADQHCSPARCMGRDPVRVPGEHARCASQELGGAPSPGKPSGLGPSTGNTRPVTRPTVPEGVSEVQHSLVIAMGMEGTPRWSLGGGLGGRPRWRRATRVGSHTWGLYGKRRSPLSTALPPSPAALSAPQVN